MILNGLFSESHLLLSSFCLIYRLAPLGGFASRMKIEYQLQFLSDL